MIHDSTGMKKVTNGTREDTIDKECSVILPQNNFRQAILTQMVWCVWGIIPYPSLMSILRIAVR